jgi:hypothetical protein
MWRAGQLAGFFALGGMLASCQSVPLDSSVTRRDFRPDNVFAYPARLTLDFRRVAVLPLAAETDSRNLPEGCETLTPVLWEQLLKTKRFEVVAVDAAKLRSRTGRVNWTGAENLPPDFFAYLRREYGCDGVLFAELTAYRAYAPLAVGWRLKLVDARSGQIVWATDELFDAARPGIARAAQRFEMPQPILPIFRAENWVAINSPQRFGRYSAAALLDTLPEH